MKKLFILLAVTCCLSVTAKNGPKDSKTTFAQEALKPYVESGQLPGAISVFYKDGIQETCCIGYADVEKKRPIKMDNVYMQCSQTKGFCGVTIAKLVEDGKISLDDPVSKYIPQYKSLMLDLGWSNGCQRLRRVKNVMNVRHLLTHTSGLDFESPVFGKDKLGWTAAPLKVTASMGAAYPLRHDRRTPTALRPGSRSRAPCGSAACRGTRRRRPHGSSATERQAGRRESCCRKRCRRGASHSTRHCGISTDDCQCP